MTLESGLRALIATVVREELARALAERGQDDEYLSPALAAQVAKVAPATIRRWIREGKIASHHAGRAIRVLRADLDSFLRSAGRAPETLTPEQAASRDFR